MHSNPFSTKFIQPGALNFWFHSEASLEGLTDKFLELPEKKALIVGPHGTGKSTLVQSIISRLEQRHKFPAIRHVRLSSDGNARKIVSQSMADWNPEDCIVVDGYEQLGLTSRYRLNRLARLHRWSLIATAHRIFRGFEILWQTEMNETIAHEVVRRLLRSYPEDICKRILDSDDWSTSRNRHQSNLRETLFDMYDWWHQNVTIPSRSTEHNPHHH